MYSSSHIFPSTWMRKCVQTFDWYCVIKLWEETFSVKITSGFLPDYNFKRKTRNRVFLNGGITFLLLLTIQNNHKLHSLAMQKALYLDYMKCYLRSVEKHNVMNDKINSSCNRCEWCNMGVKIAVEILSRASWPDLGLNRCTVWQSFKNCPFY